MLKCHMRRCLSSPDAEVSERTLQRSTQQRHSRTSTAADSSSSAYESSTLGRARTRIKTTTRYTSGTQSAYGSRDQSPDTSSNGYLSSKRSNLPRAPPSMIISPSQTPKREHSAERKRSTFTEVDMQTLYAKLGEIESATTERAHGGGRKSRAIEKERRGLRVLTKSMSVDNPSDEIPIYRTNHNQEPVMVTARSKKYAAIAKIHSGLFDDAPLSSTLPASLVIGELVITPGAASLTKKARRLSKQRSGSASPKTARRQFFGAGGSSNTTTTPKSYFSWPKRDHGKAAAAAAAESTNDDSGSELEDDDESERETTSRSSSVSMTIPDDRPTRPEKRSLLSSLLSIAKDKRKMFKRSKSVDSSPVSSTVVRAGVSSMSPAAPSSYEPPKVPVYEPPATKTPKPKKPAKFRRAASVDASALFGVTSQSSHSSVVSSIIAQREAVLSSGQKDVKKNSVSVSYFS